MSQGIKESLELLEALKLLVGIVKKIGADGKVDISDVSVLLSSLSDLNKIVEGVKGAVAIKEEAKDLDPAEISALIAKALEIVQAARA